MDFRFTLLFFELVKFIPNVAKKHVFLETQPEQVHISYGNNEMERVVTWTTFSPTGPPIVEFGESTMNQRAEGYSKIFVDGGKRKRKIFIHRVTLRNLLPNTHYLYHCGSKQGWSDQFWFKTSRAADDWSLSLAVYGDMGNVNAVSLTSLQQLAQNHEIDAAIHVGDMAYNLDSENGRVGDAFMRQIQPIASYVPYMVCPGNHEQKYNFSHFRERFSMPGDNENLFYSFNIGKVHFVSINTEAYWYLKYGSQLTINQYNWLIKDLEKANNERRIRPWIVVYGHRPMYCSSVSPECEMDAPTRRGLNGTDYGIEPLLQKYGVDIVFSGHQHLYERHFPIYNYKVANGSTSPYVDPKAPVHIITGSAGCKEDIRPFSSNPLESSAFRSSDYGITLIQFHNSSHMSLKQIATNKNEVIDEMVLVKNKHGPYTL